MRLKLFAVLTVVALFSVSHLNAQVRSKWELGIKSGVNVSGSRDIDYSLNTGYNIGGFADYNITNRWFLRSGLEITKKGGTFEGNIYDYPMGKDETSGLNSYFSGNSKYSVSMNYLQLPLTIGYRLPLSEKASLNFNLGGYVSYGLSAKTTSIINGTLLTGDVREALNTTSKFYKWESTGLKRYDYGLLGGIGLEYNKFIFGVNYELGLRELRTTPIHSELVPQIRNSFKNVNLAFSIGYKF